MARHRRCPHHGQDLKGEDRLLLVGHEPPEQEVDAGIRVLDQDPDLAGDEVEHVPADRPAQDEQGEPDLHGETDRDRPPADGRGCSRTGTRSR